MMKNRRKVVVVTGASSGIGKATAIEFVKKKCSVVLAARRRNALKITETECRKYNVDTIVVPTDVSEENSVKRLAEKTRSNFGRIDVWVNNASVYALGTFEEVPASVYQQVLQTNIMSVVYGSKEAIIQFRTQKREGVIVNLSSVFGIISPSFVSAYSASKFAVRSLSESMRNELKDTHISVCTILPASIDTPIFIHSANYTGHAINPIKPVYNPEEVARTIVHVAENPENEVFVGTAGELLSFLYRIFPGLTSRLLTKQVEKDHFEMREAKHTSGNIFKPMQEGTSIHGGWKGNS